MVAFYQLPVVKKDTIFGPSYFVTVLDIYNKLDDVRKLFFAAKWDTQIKGYWIQLGWKPLRNSLNLISF